MVNGSDDHFIRREYSTCYPDGRIESNIICPFLSGDCFNETMRMYEYSPAVERVHSFTWDDHAWTYRSRTTTYAGSGMYSDRPDSILYEQYLEDSGTHLLRTRSYLRYEALGTDSVYFIQDDLTYHPASDTWTQQSLREEWYHRNVSTDVVDLSEGTVVLFPNPCRAGELLQIKSSEVSSGISSISIYTLHGMLIRTYASAGTVDFKAPDVLDCMQCCSVIHPGGAFIRAYRWSLNRIYPVGYRSSLIRFPSLPLIR